MSKVENNRQLNSPQPRLGYFDPTLFLQKIANSDNVTNNICHQ